MKNTITNFVRYSRLHTIIGTTLSLFSLYIIAIALTPDIKDFHFTGFILTWISCLGANIYIVGLNQITDIEIDKINKPYLPLASGAYSKQQGYIINTIALLISVSIAFYLGTFLLIAVFSSLLLGTLYSLPPFRLKRYYFWAAFCIIAVRGIVVNIFLFLHLHEMVLGFHNIPPLIFVLTAAIFIYSIVIAWFKDIPDMAGDQQHFISTLTLRMGAKSVFKTGIFLLSATLIILIALVWFIAFPIHVMIFTTLHILMLILLWLFASKTDITNKKSIARFYQFVWILFFMEYITFALSTYLHSV